MSVEVTIIEQGQSPRTIRLSRVPCLYEYIWIDGSEFKATSVRHFANVDVLSSAEVVVMRFNQGEKAGEST